MRPVHAALALACLLASPLVLADTGTGKSPTTTETRATGAFTGLSISTVLEVELAVGGSTKVELRGPKAWLDRINTTVKDGVLVVSMPGNYKKIPKLTAVISTPSLASLAISGVADLVGTGLSGASFDLSVSGTGEVELAGKVDATHFDLSGAAEVEAKDLVAKTADLDISGTGNVSLHASKKLDVSISGVGAVTAYGKPATVNKRITGTGTIDLD